MKSSSSPSALRTRNSIAPPAAPAELHWALPSTSAPQGEAGAPASFVRSRRGAVRPSRLVQPVGDGGGTYGWRGRRSPPCPARARSAGRQIGMGLARNSPARCGRKSSGGSSHLYFGSFRFVSPGAKTPWRSDPARWIRTRRGNFPRRILIALALDDFEEDGADHRLGEDLQHSPPGAPSSSKPLAASAPHPRHGPANASPDWRSKWRAGRHEAHALRSRAFDRGIISPVPSAICWMPSP